MAIGGTFVTYTVPTQIIVAAAQAQVIAEINKFVALFPDPTAVPSNAHTRPHTDFDLIHPATVLKIRAEIAALIVAIDAAPIA